MKAIAKTIGAVIGKVCFSLSESWNSIAGRVVFNCLMTLLTVLAVSLLG